MIPLQIYCDFLEDKGIDCRLFRTIEYEDNDIVYRYYVQCDIIINSYQKNEDDIATGGIFFGSDPYWGKNIKNNGDGDGSGPGYGWFRGDGQGEGWVEWYDGEEIARRGLC